MRPVPVLVIASGNPHKVAEIGAMLHKSLAKQGLEILLETRVTGATVAGDKAVVHTQTKDGKALDIPCDRVLVSVGRRAFVDGLGLDAAGVEVQPNGFVPTDAYQNTNVPGVYAIGDIHGSLTALDTLLAAVAPLDDDVLICDHSSPILEVALVVLVPLAGRIFHALDG